MDGDFLLLELKQLLKKHQTLKLVLMSATINHETFVKYFNNAPLLTIPGFAHPVTDIYLEDILSIVDYRPPVIRLGKSSAKQQNLREEYQSEGIQTSVAIAIENIIRSDRIDYQVSVFPALPDYLLMLHLVNCCACQLYYQDHRHQRWHTYIPPRSE